MKIAQVSPLFESVPPHFYGGTERIVSYLTEELVRQNHEVTLFASGDSVTSARLVPCSERSLRLDKTCVDAIPHHLLMLERLYRMAGEFDIIHFHIDYFHYSLTRRYRFPNVTTLHGRLDIPDLVPLYHEYTEIGGHIHLRFAALSPPLDKLAGDSLSWASCRPAAVQ